MKRIFLATAKGDSPDKIAEWTQELVAALPGVTVTDGLADWEANFSRCGGWNGWAQDVAQGRDINGRHRYDGIVCPYLCVGKATAQIIELALQAGKPVIASTGSQARRVIGVVQVDPHSWKAGWELVTEGHTA
jgi:hypothetical protein